MAPMAAQSTGPSSASPIAVSDDLDGEGLGGGPGDGEVGQDDLGQARDLLDVGVDEVPGHPPGATDPVADDVEGGGRVLPTEPGQSGPERQRWWEQAPEQRGETDTESESDDDISAIYVASLSKRRGMGWGRDRRFMAANPQANREAAARSATWPAGVPNGLK